MKVGVREVYRSLVSAAGMLSVAFCLLLHAMAYIMWHAHLLKVLYPGLLCTITPQFSNDDIDWKDGDSGLQLNRSTQYKIFSTVSIEWFTHVFVTKADPHLYTKKGLPVGFYIVMFASQQRIKA